MANTMVMSILQNFARVLLELGDLAMSSTARPERAETRLLGVFEDGEHAADVRFA